MRHIYYVSVLIILFTMTCVTTYSAENPNALKKNLERVEINLINGVNSDNQGLKASSAYFLGEIKSSKAVIPLMKMLHEEKSEGTRIMAALSLLKIGDKRGIFAIKQGSKFDESEKVRKMCGLFYNNYTHEQLKSK